MEPPTNCPECGATWQEGSTCQDHFHQMLFWENERPEYGEVHHLMVLCYHLQHPGLYSPEGLSHAKGLLSDFLEGGLGPAEVRRRNRAAVNSSNRAWKITGSPGARGSYERPVRWTMTAADVVASGIDGYPDRVREWARSIRQAIAQ